MFKPGQVMYARAAGKIHRRNCECCGVALTPHQGLSSGICDKPACHEWMIERVGRELLERKRKENAAKLEKVFEAASPMVEQAIEEIGAEEGDYTRCKLPYQDSPVDDLPSERETEFLKHLRKIVANSFADELPERDLKYRENLEREQHDVLDTACSACRGGCCATAGNTAFLSEDDINRWRQRNPDGTQEQVVGEYLDVLPFDTIQDGCVFQGPDGCTMPRSMRADQCHTFYCKALKNLQEELKDSTHGKTVFVADKDLVPVSVTGWSPETGRIPIVNVPAPEKPAPGPIVFSSADF